MNAADAERLAPWVDGSTGAPSTVHGFRPSFRVGAGEKTTYAREVVEAAFAHTVESATERAYRRSDLVERRRALKEESGRWCMGLVASH